MYIYVAPITKKISSVSLQLVLCFSLDQDFYPKLSSNSTHFTNASHVPSKNIILISAHLVLSFQQLYMIFTFIKKQCWSDMYQLSLVLHSGTTPFFWC